MLDRTWTIGKLVLSPRGSRTEGEPPVEPCRIGEAPRVDGAHPWCAGGWKLAYSRRHCLVVGWIGRRSRMDLGRPRRLRLKFGRALHRFADRFAVVPFPATGGSFMYGDTPLGESVRPVFGPDPNGVYPTCEEAGLGQPSPTGSPFGA